MQPTPGRACMRARADAAACGPAADPAVHRRARALRARDARLRDRAAAPRTPTSGRRPSGSPTRCSAGWPRPATWGCASTRPTAAPGTRWPPRCSSRSSPAAGRAGSRPGSAPTPGSRCRRSSAFGTEEQKQRYLVPGLRGRARGRAGHHRARRGLRRRRPAHPRPPRRRRLGGQRSQDVHHRRRAGRRARLPRCGPRRRGRPSGHLVPARSRRATASTREPAAQARLARLGHRRDRLRRRVRARGEPARSPSTAAST